MEQYYLEIRAVHIGAVILSGALLLLRGVAHNLLTASWAMAWPIRAVSYTVDTTLLTAALMLTTVVQQYPFVDNWLTMKVMLVLVYIYLGYMALWGATERVRWWSLGSAALIYGFIISIARAHSPLGVFS